MMAFTIIIIILSWYLIICLFKIRLYKYYFNIAGKMIYDVNESTNFTERIKYDIVDLEGKKLFNPFFYWTFKSIFKTKKDYLNLIKMIESI